MAGQPELRIGDAEREAAAASLREHYAQGRLSLDELNERLGTSFTATTQSQLDRVTADLPHVQAPWGPAAAPPPPTPPAAAGRSGGASIAAVAGGLVTVALVVLALHGFSDGHRGPGIIVLVVGLLIIRAVLARIFGWRRPARGRVHHHGHHHHHGHGHSGDQPW